MKKSDKAEQPEFTSKRPDGKGHRRPLSEGDPTRMYTLRVPESLHKALKKLGTAKVRGVLEALTGLD